MTKKNNWKSWATVSTASLAGAACLMATPAAAQQAWYGYDYSTYQNTASQAQYGVSPQAVVAPRKQEGSRVSFVRGDDLGDDVAGTRPQQASPASRGFTIRINPTADLDAPLEPVTTVTVGGYAKGDLFFDTEADSGDSFSFATVPLEGSTEDDREHFRAFADQSRVRVRSATDLPNGIKVRTLIEADFEGEPTPSSSGGNPPGQSVGIGNNQLVSNSAGFRLRHAWGSISKGPWTVLIGQSWTNFMHLHSYPDTVDFFGPVGNLFIRAGQILVTYKALDNLEFKASAENPEFATTFQTPELSPESFGGFTNDRIPDFTVSAQFQVPIGPISTDTKVAGVFGEKNVEDPVSGIFADDFFWGFSVGTIASLGPVRAFATFNIGEGIGRYQLATFQDGGFDLATGEIILFDTWSVNAGLAYDITETITVQSVFSIWEIDESEATIATTGAALVEELISIHNTIWYTPADSYRLGAEVVLGFSDLIEDPVLFPGTLAGIPVAGAEGENIRILLTGQFFF